MKNKIEVLLLLGVLASSHAFAQTPDTDATELTDGPQTLPSSESTTPPAQDTTPKTEVIPSTPPADDTVEESKTETKTEAPAAETKETPKETKKSPVLSEEELL